MDPITLALLSAGISAGGSALGGLFGKQNASPENQWVTPPQTDLGKKKMSLIDDLMASLRGEGSYNDLFAMDEDAFNKSYVEPAKARFNNQTAPQIQQNSIFSGQQRSSGLDNQLAQAGIDMDQLLNQQYYQFQQDALNRKAGGINSILGQPDSQTPQLIAGKSPGQSGGQAAGQGVGGYFAGKAFKDDLDNLLSQYKTEKPKTANNTTPDPLANGFA